jgi:hypothetical protein
MSNFNLIAVRIAKREPIPTKNLAVIFGAAIASWVVIGLFFFAVQR